MTNKALSGYRKKPFAIYFFSAIYFLLPFLSLLQFSIDLDGSGVHLKEIIFSQAFLLETFLSFSAAYAIFSVTRMGFHYFLGLSIYAVVIKLYHLRAYHLFENPSDLIAAFLWLGTSLILVFSTLRIPYLNPSAKWWTQAPRHAHFCPGVLHYGKYSFPIVTLDMSVTGVFLKLDERAQSEESVSVDPAENRRSRKIIRNPFMSETEIQEARNSVTHYPSKIGEEVRVKIHMIEEAKEIFPAQTFEAVCEVVWATKPDSAYRYGLGLRFSDLDSLQKKQLKKYASLMKQMAILKPR